MKEANAKCTARRARSNCDGTCPKRVLGGPDKNLLYFDFSEVGNGPHAGSAGASRMASVLAGGQF